MTWHVSTMDEQKHLTWARDYDATTRAGLRKMIEGGLEKMVADALYPTGAATSGPTPTPSDSVFFALQMAPNRLMIEE
jgi:hypothetical protein